ncbi:MAG: hypothetical protein LBR70_05985 [Lactobacillaceae bacterium]|jgi:hypothetical protein|nr:hypothetical protein [Lactobacillaceae bacterium]
MEQVISILTNPGAFNSLTSIVDGIDTQSIKHEDWKLALNEASNIHQWAAKIRVGDSDFVITIPVVLECDETAIAETIGKTARILSADEVISELMPFKSGSLVMFNEAKIYPGVFILVVKDGVQMLEKYA